MSINNKGNLKEVAKLVCRELRNKSTKPEKIFWELVRKKRFFG